MATITLRNVPDELYALLKARAAANRRSLNQEAILSLRLGIGARSQEESRRAFEHAGELRRQSRLRIDHRLVDALIDEGRV